MIAGQTASKYLVTTADLGHTLVSQVIASNKYGSSPPAKSKASGLVPLPTQYWYACAKGEAKVAYSDPGCTIEAAKGSYIWKKLTTSTSLTMNGTTPFTWTWKMGGSDYAVTCSTQTSSGGTASNPEKGAGTASVTLSFGSCATSKPVGLTCNATLQSKKYNGALGEFQGKPAVQFTPTESYAQVITLSGPSCGAGFKGQSYYFSGSFAGVSNPATSSLEFTNASSNMLALSGRPRLKAPARSKPARRRR